VVGPKAVPVVREVEVAKRDPELAVLSAMAHGRDADGPAIALAALAASVGLNEERALLYSDVILASLSEVTRAAMEELMASGNYEYQSEFAKTHQAKGRAEGRAEGEARGEAKGRAEGEARGEARSLLTVLDARGLVVSAEQKERITTCTDLELLGRWLRKAVTARSAEELFEP
jgi:flagellar biosynthesis/type III secretory pathway protein FliH